MSLPDNNQPWPPKGYADAYAKMHEWSAWYSGDPDELSRIYQHIGQRLVNTPDVRPSQLRGGLMGTLARWWWGQPIPPGEKRSKIHVPLPADIATTSADLLFSEPITLESEDTSTQDKLGQLLDDEMHATLLESAEVCAALSGVYLRVVWDRDVNPDGPWLSPVHGDAAIPEWTYGRLKAVTFVRVLTSDPRVVVRHLERHEVGMILHGVYEGSDTELGRRVPLSNYADLAGLAEVVEDGDTIPTGIDQLTAVYIPNIRPNRYWRNLPACAPLGRSDFASNEPVFDALDETMASWMRDIRLGKGRVIVPESFLQSRGPGRGALFDADREAYESLNMIPQPDGQGSQLTIAQFTIRVKEHSDTCDALIARAISTAGYSQQTFGEAADAAITATEVAARERKSLITRDKKIKYWRPRLAEITQAQLKIGQVHFGWRVDPSTRPTIGFPDAVQQDPASLASTLQLLEAAKSASAEVRVRMLHPDWDDDQVTKEVEALKAEFAVTPAVTNPDTFAGPDFPGGPMPDGIPEPLPAGM